MNWTHNVNETRIFIMHLGEWVIKLKKNYNKWWFQLAFFFLQKKSPNKDMKCNGNIQQLRIITKLCGVMVARNMYIVIVVLSNDI